MILRKALLALVFTLTAGVLAVGCGGGSASLSDRELTLGTIGWTENVAISNLTKVVMEEELGYGAVEIQGPLDVGALFQGTATGDLAAFQDVWMPNNQNYLDEVEDQVELLDPWYEGETMYGIAALDYMGVDSLANLDQANTNEIIGIEPGASFHPQIRDEVFPTYNLDDFDLVESSTPAMLAAVEEASNANEPILFLAWSPHWMNQQYDITYLEDPEDAQGDFDDPSRITSIVNGDLEEEDPVAYAFLNAIRMNQEQLEGLEAEINDAEGEAAESDAPLQGARNWLEGNRDVVQPWVEAAEQAQGS